MQVYGKRQFCKDNVHLKKLEILPKVIKFEGMFRKKNLVTDVKTS